MSDFKKLTVWRKAHGLALNIHRLLSLMRGTHHVSLRTQMLRAAMSIPANIVEGSAQESGKEFGRFLSIAIKSTSELEYHLIFAESIRAITKNDFESLNAQLVEVRKMLYSLRDRVITTPRLTRKTLGGVVNACRDVPTS
ncbi:MAG TPA: four helix bundle protein [Gemmatimonadaceae bacterium]